MPKVFQPTFTRSLPTDLSQEDIRFLKTFTWCSECNAPIHAYEDAKFKQKSFMCQDCAVKYN